MIKSKEQISLEKKEYYLKNRVRLKMLYYLRKKTRTIPFAKYSTPNSELLPEHAFEFTGINNNGEDISEEREKYYLSVIC